MGSLSRPLVHTKGLTVRYGRRPPAVEKVDLDILAGELVALLGPNGSGKTTLLRALAGDLRAASGSIERAALASGYAGDEAVHADALGTRANALAFARANGTAQAERAVDHLLGAFGLAAWTARPAGELSFGNRRKLQLIEAFAHTPRLLFLDEPTLGLDPDASSALTSLLRRTAADGGAVLMATNDVAFAQEIATRVVFMRQGRLVTEGTPDALMRAVRQTTRIEVDVAGTPPPVAFRNGVHATAGADGYVLQTDGGSAALPEICAALTDAGAHITSIRIVRADLTDAFRTMTGETWQPEATSRERVR